MSVPLGLFTTEPIITPFRSPINGAYSPLQQSVLGGTAIGNGAAGREVQVWTVFYDAGVINVAPQSGSVAFTLAVPGVLSVSLGFDSNMQVAIGYTTIAGAYFYFYDFIGGAFTTLAIVGATSCRVCVDDPRLFNTVNSDVIFAYTRAGSLYYRQQRDRYLVEMLIGIARGPLLRAGPNVENHLQFQIKPT